MRYRELRLLLRISRSHGILRRYFVVNGFDGALTMLGLNMGFYLSGAATPQVALSACLGAAIALGMSGLTSAYISESAERSRWLKELEDAMVADMDESVHSTATRVVPLLVALVNGSSPLLISLLICSPWWLATVSPGGGWTPAELAIFLAILSLFCLGVFLGVVSSSSWFWSGVKAMLIASVTAALIVIFGG